MKLARLYISDAIINVAAHTILLFIAYIALISGSMTFVIIWFVIATGYATVLAKLADGCEQRGAQFKYYVLFAMLPANIIAAVVGLIYIVVGASASYLRGNIIAGVVIIVGSAIITGIAIFINRFVLHEK